MMNLEQKLRSGHVRRWHIVAVAREQTLADHMYRVGVISEEILKILGLFDWGNDITQVTMRWAAIHDRHEYLMGDIPTPSKAMIEGEAHDGALAAVEREIDPEAAELRDAIAEGPLSTALRIVKLADTIEAVNYVGIFGVGSHAREVWQGLYMAARRRAYDLIEIDKLDYMQSNKIYSLIETLKENPRT